MISYLLLAVICFVIGTFGFVLRENFLQKMIFFQVLMSSIILFFFVVTKLMKLTGSNVYAVLLFIVLLVDVCLGFVLVMNSKYVDHVGQDA